MEARELRMGNLIYYNCLFYPKEIVEITPLFFASLVNSRGYEEKKKDMVLNGYFQPIPLTPEWLERGGFSKVNERSYKLMHFGKFIFLGSMGLTFRPAGQLDKILRQDNIQHVHTLQNMVYYIVGTELEFKEIPVV